MDQNPTVGCQEHNVAQNTYDVSRVLTRYEEKYMKKLTGNTDIEDSLDRLDKLTQEEMQMASAELLKITHSVEGNVQDVRSNVQDIGSKVQGVNDRVQGIGSDVNNLGSDVKDISSEVRVVDDKLDQVNRPLSL